MKKEEALILLKTDIKKLAEVFPQTPTNQGSPFKDEAAYDSGDICYIAEFALEDLHFFGFGDPDIFYDKEDFIRICDGNEKKARMLFDYVDWQHPETVLDEDPEIFDEYI